MTTHALPPAGAAPKTERLRDLTADMEHDAAIYRALSPPALGSAQQRSDIAASLRALIAVSAQADEWAERGEALRKEEHDDYINGAPTNMVKRTQAEALKAAADKLRAIIGGSGK